MLDQHVAYYLRKHPEFFQKHIIAKVRPAVYNLDGRVIEVDWHYGEAGREGYLVAIDGPLRQPFDDYLQGSETNAQFDEGRLARTSLHQIPKGRQLSFRDDNAVYSRLEAMKVAKEQALVREQAAVYVKEGALVPESELMAKYKKTIDVKLGNRWRRQTSPPPTNTAPVAASPRLQAPSQSRYGSPVYCTNHSTSGQRPKTAPRSVQCASCKATVQTNYAEFTLCPACSESEGRCVCCGSYVNGGQSNWTAGKAGLPPPAYCANHDSSEKRPKTHPRNVECRLCRTVIQTNYVEFAICATCSNSTQRCMCCGNTAAVGSTPPPVDDTSATYSRNQAGALSPKAAFNPLLPQTGRLPSQQVPPQQAAYPANMGLLPLRSPLAPTRII